MSYSPEEREVVLQWDEEGQVWSFYSRVRKFNTRVSRLKGFNEISRETTETGGIIELHGTLPTSCVSFRNLKEKVEVSEEERKLRAERAKINFAKARKEKKGIVE